MIVKELIAVLQDLDPNTVIKVNACCDSTHDLSNVVELYTPPLIHHPEDVPEYWLTLAD